ncbi:MAG TPA: GntR family transcriptional regulator [Telmatospirillum sp.]|nr:GntR family transcriptional regulator [Telmatospirillum sp.]
MFVTHMQTPAVDLAGKAAEALAREIISGRIAPENPLPKETDLVKQFAISRATLRSSLQTLESVGLINRVSGHGTFVRPHSDWAFLSPVLSRWISAFAPPRPPFLRDIISFRLSNEPIIAMIAARLARGRDLQDMEDAFAGMSAHAFDPRDPDESFTSFDRYDLAFHQAIYRATGNLIWTQMTPIIEPAIRLVIHQSNTEADELRDSLNRHGELLIHIRRQNAAGAHAAALDILRRTAQDLGISLELVPSAQACLVIDGQIPAVLTPKYPDDQ